MANSAANSANSGAISGLSLVRARQLQFHCFFETFVALFRIIQSLPVSMLMSWLAMPKINQKLKEIPIQG